MVTGFESFKEWFAGYSDQFAIIGGTACDLLMSEEGEDFRATKDIDMVLIVESLTPEFGLHFWQYVKAADYKHRRSSNGQPQYYRFTHPRGREYPYMIELFSRKPDAISLPEDAVLTPMPLDDDLSSLSAILLDDDYYQLLLTGKHVVDGVPIVGAEQLILFKAKAWLDLTLRKNAGEAIDSRDIRKHKNDVFRLSLLLTPTSKLAVPQSVYQDFQHFLAAMETEPIDLKQLGIHMDRATVLDLLKNTYSAAI